jgi:ribosome-binding ATPase YchF (GTP1/OBG family)
VKGASQGEGLGNQFLANIRETDAIVHVVRCFDDDDVLHVMGSVDPVRDREVIEFELALADLATVEKRLDRARRTAKTGDKDAAAEVAVLERAHEFLKEGRGLWEAKLRPEQLEALQPLSLLTIKPILYAANVTDAELTGAEGAHLGTLRSAVAASGELAQVVPFSAKIESELAELPEGIAPSSWRRSAWRAPASTGSSAPATTCSGCRPTSPPASRRCARGRSTAGTPRPRRRG